MTIIANILLLFAVLCLLVFNLPLLFVILPFLSLAVFSPPPLRQKPPQLIPQFLLDLLQLGLFLLPLERVLYALCRLPHEEVHHRPDDECVQRAREGDNIKGHRHIWDGGHQEERGRVHPRIRVATAGKCGVEPSCGCGDRRRVNASEASHAGGQVHASVGIRRERLEGEVDRFVVDAQPEGRVPSQLQVQFDPNGRAVAGGAEGQSRRDPVGAQIGEGQLPRLRPLHARTGNEVGVPRPSSLVDAHPNGVQDGPEEVGEDVQSANPCPFARF
mmetsp:Transcript_3905/g.10745  ORF Transcript_3905/g.10745 Transcript_3905/m.10745 type:complete len:273 (-) Transcript_3905:1527-2345(-)